MTTRHLIALCATAALAACGGGDKEAAAPAAPEKAAVLAPGDYEVVRTVSQLSSTDQSTPKTKASANSSSTIRACVTGDALPEAMFAEEGDACETKNSYVRSGKINLQLACTRPGAPGQIVPAVDGEFEREAFEATVKSATYFQGPGDYSMTTKITGKRVGDCPAGAAPKAG